MAKCYELEGVKPVISPTAFVHPEAVLIGDAVVGPKCYVGPGAVMRGDMGRVELKEGANLQDNCIMHSFPDAECIVEVNGHVGHGAVLHGCRVGYEALIGMHAVIMDEAVIGDYAIVAASACVPAKMQVPERSLIAGVPAKFMRELSDEEIAWKVRGTVEYQVLAERCLATLKEVEPLSALDADRPRLNVADIKPLKDTRTG